MNFSDGLYVEASFTQKEYLFRPHVYGKVGLLQDEMCEMVGIFFHFSNVH